MSRRAITWGMVVRYCNKHGYRIKQSKSGEKVIYPPQGVNVDPRAYSGVRISHECCGHDHDVLFGCYVSKLRNQLKFDMDELGNS